MEGSCGGGIAPGGFRRSSDFPGACRLASPRGEEPPSSSTEQAAHEAGPPPSPGAILPGEPTVCVIPRTTSFRTRRADDACLPGTVATSANPRSGQHTARSEGRFRSKTEQRGAHNSPTESRNCSIVKPAARTRLRSVPLATSLWSGMDSVAMCPSDHDDVATPLPRYLLPKSLKRLHHLPAAEHRNHARHAKTSTWCISTVSGKPFSARTSRQSRMASLMWVSASSRVFPWLTQPGIAGHSATQMPSSSRSSAT